MNFQFLKLFVVVVVLAIAIYKFKVFVLNIAMHNDDDSKFQLFYAKLTPLITIINIYYTYE